MAAENANENLGENPSKNDASSAQSSDTTLLRLAGPWQIDSFTAVLDNGDTLTVTRSGTDVPSKSVDSLIEDAAKNGVRLEGK